MNVSFLPFFRAVDLSAISGSNHGHQMCCTELSALQSQSKFRKKIGNTYKKDARGFNTNWPLQIKSSLKGFCSPKATDEWTLAAV